MPIKYVPYNPEPIEGQALLNNFQRLLRYRGDGEVRGRIERGMPYYEVELQEKVGASPDENLVFRGECITTCAYLKDKGIKVDLVYIDPPFASGADYAKKVYLRRNPKVSELIAKVEQELNDSGEEVDMTEEFRAFEEKMYGDIWDKEKYLNWMYENLQAIKSVMNEFGVLYVHLDHQIGFYIKIILDEIFGDTNWLNTITWRSQVARGAKVNAFYYPYSSHFLMIYGKNKDKDNNVWNRESKEIKISEEDAEKNFQKDEFGYFRTSDPGTSNYDAIVRLNNEHRIYVTKGGVLLLDEGKREFKTSRGTIGIKYYLRKEGNDYVADRAIDNIWDDIPGLGTTPSEDLGYTTQKTEALLERIIKASSDKGMVVADFFGGSGVTAAVASKLGRDFITADIGLNSVQTMRDRLIADGASFSVYEIQDGVSLYRNPAQTMDKLKSLIPGLKNEDSLNCFWEGSFTDSKLGMVPVYIPNLLDSSSKVLDSVLMNQILHQAIPDLPSGVKKVVVFFIDIDNKPEIEKFIKDSDATTIEIELRDLKSVLSDLVFNDEVAYHLEEVQPSLLEKGFRLTIDRFFSDRVIQKIEDFNQRSFAQSTKGKAYKPILISDEGLETIEWLSLDCTASEGEWHADAEIKIEKNSYATINGEKTNQFWDGTIFHEKRPIRLKIRNICGDESVFAITC